MKSGNKKEFSKLTVIFFFFSQIFSLLPNFPSHFSRFLLAMDREIKNMDAMLRCPVCYEFFNIAMMLTGCSHNCNSPQITYSPFPLPHPPFSLSLSPSALHSLPSLVCSLCIRRYLEYEQKCPACRQVHHPIPPPISCLVSPHPSSCSLASSPAPPQTSRTTGSLTNL